jgi:hypothetical protein
LYACGLIPPLFRPGFDPNDDYPLARHGYRESIMKYCVIMPIIGLFLVLVLVAGCDGPFRTLWHGENLASGGSVKVTSFNLVWSVEHDDRDVSKDCFAIEYVTAIARADVAQREAEAAQVFELIRPVSEQWGLRSAQMAAFPLLERKGHYDLYLFERQADGHWSFKRSDTKVFATD